MDIGQQFTGIIGKHLIMEAQTPIDDALDKYDAMYGSAGDYADPNDYKGNPEVDADINKAVFHNMSTHIAFQQQEHGNAWLHLNKTGFALHRAAGKMLNWDKPWLGDPSLEVRVLATEIHTAGTKAVDLAKQYRDLVEKGTPKERG